MNPTLFSKALSPSATLVIYFRVYIRLILLQIYYNSEHCNLMLSPYTLLFNARKRLNVISVSSTAVCCHLKITFLAVPYCSSNPMFYLKS